jgi:hypothetical protein
MKIKFLILIMMVSATLAGFTSDKDPFKWLEEVEGEKALEWVTWKKSVKALIF